MMGRQDGLLRMMILDIESMIPDNHLLRRIKNSVNFDFIYEKAAPLFKCIIARAITTRTRMILFV